ncbi:MAG: DUF1476 domain-containing protein [Planctomycetota bacterium]
MAGFNERKRGMETKLAQDSELMFKVRSRRNRLLGEWAAGHLGLAGDEAEAYTQAVIKADLEEPGCEDVFRKLAADLDNVSEDEIRKQISTLMQTAEQQVREAA